MASEQQERLLSNLSTAERANGDGHAADPDHELPLPAIQAPPADSIRTKYAWLAVYFGLNLALTLYNKAVMGKVSRTLPCSHRAGG